MSDLSNDMPLSKETSDDEFSGTSPKVMLVTIVLLIAGLTLTGIMMLHYSKSLMSTSPAADAPEKTSAALAPPPIASSLSQPSQKMEPAETSEAIVEPRKPGVIDQLMGKRENKVKWPKLKLTGFGTSADGSGGFAFINGRKYHPGDQISSKVTLIEIRQNNVLVECEGETKTLTVNSMN